MKKFNRNTINGTLWTDSVNLYLVIRTTGLKNENEWTITELTQGLYIYTWYRFDHLMTFLKDRYTFVGTLKDLDLESFLAEHNGQS